MLPAAGANLYLCRALLAGASSDEEITRVKGVFTAAYRIECSARSPFVEFVFMYPEAHVEWSNAAFGIKKGNFQLQATKAIDTGCKPTGYDRHSHALFYSFHVLSMSSADPAMIRTAMTATIPAPIVSIESVEPESASEFGINKWAVTFANTICPEGLKRKRTLEVTTNDSVLEMGVHHPRTGYRIPCRACLSTRHNFNDCKSSNPAPSAASFTENVTVAPTFPPELLVAPNVDDQRLILFMYNSHQRCITANRPKRRLLFVLRLEDQPRQSPKQLFKLLASATPKFNEHAQLLENNGK
uniref:Uncharacterized protein n=1 Tax=Peronospora matthiolae TaxID=2874970 RepID=A0AAV1TLW3_9STRA